MKRILIGSDHVSIALKNAVAVHLANRGLDVVDYGPQSGEVIVDYTDYSQKVARAVASGEGDGGIVICGTGLGASIAANKVKGIRAALCHDVFTAHQSRAHNDANVLALGAWVVSPERMPGIVDEWLTTSFEGGRHIARVQVLDRYLCNEMDQMPSFDPNCFQYAIALSTRETLFGPVLFPGRLQEGFSTLQKCGIKNVELSLRFADDLPLDQLRDLLKTYSLKVTALATGQGCLHDQLCLNSSNPELYQAAIRRLEQIVELADRLECDVILGGVRGRLNGTRQEQEAQRKRITDGILHCCKYAEKYGITILNEAINRYETNFINTAADAVALIQQTGASNLKVLLDTFHMNIEEVDMPTAIRLTNKHLGYIHLVDSNRQAPGQGHTDLKSVLHTLCEVGYTGVVSAEILPIPDDASAVQRTANYLDSIGVNL